MESVKANAPTLLPIAADLANLTVGISMHHITGFAVTASIHHRRIPYYIGSLREGEIYELRNFEVVPAYERYRVTTARHSLRFTDGTQLKDAAGDAHQIRNELFYTLTYEEYLALANTCSKLPDVVGQILSIQGPNLSDPTSNQKIIILLRLAKGTSVRMTIWDQQSALFRQQFHKHGQSTTIVVCTSLNPKLFAGNLYLNTMGATKFYFDNRLEAVREITDQEKISLTLELESGDAVRATLWDATAINFRKRWTTLERKPLTVLLTTMNPKTIRGAINLHSTDATRLFFDNDIHETRDYHTRLRDKLEDAVLLESPSKIPKIEVVTIAELKAFTRGGTRQTATFQCVAEVNDVIGQDDWFYISCPRCQTRKIISGAVLLCANEACGSDEAIGVPRFLFELVVHDNTGTTTFTMTDYVGQTLAGVSAANLAEQLIGENGGTHNLRFTPQTLLAIIGDQYTFQIRASPDPIDVGSQTVAVTRLIGIEQQHQ